MIDDDEDVSGYAVGITCAYCHHCDYAPGLNTPRWRLWLHLCLKHPRAAWDLKLEESGFKYDI